MKERPIIFSGEMVRAILDGRKTQTRRPIKKLPECVILDMKREPEQQDPYMAKWLLKTLKCPYGQPGLKLWVREAFYPHDGFITYKADLLPYRELSVAWKPSIHMPRCASRITLEIDEIRVERVQDISEEDAKAEGCEFFVPSIRHEKWKNKWVAGYCRDCNFFNPYTGLSKCCFSFMDDAPKFRPSCGCQSGFVLRDDLSPEPSRFRFSFFWDALPYLGWSADLWVWVIKFHRVEARG